MCLEEVGQSDAHPRVECSKEGWNQIASSKAAARSSSTSRPAPGRTPLVAVRALGLDAACAMTTAALHKSH